MKVSFSNWWYTFFLFSFLLISCSQQESNPDQEGATTKASITEGKNEWTTLWDGHSFDHWRASENPTSFSIEDGKIVVNGPRGHLFYEGPFADANFKNFELKADVYTYPNSNSGIFFHTKYQEEGWPQQGYEAQVNATYDKDPRKTGSLYSVEDVMHDAPHQDKQWFTYHIKVKGQQITFKIDDKVVMEYTEPEDREGPNHLSSGTIALQAHDPGSRVYYRNIQARVLPE